MTETEEPEQQPEGKPQPQAAAEGDDREDFRQPPPGSTGHEEAKDSDLPVEPEVDEADGEGTAGEQSDQANQESKHSYPTSDPPANY